MASVYMTDYCATCGKQSKFEKPRINHVLHLILSVLTLSIWAVVVWLPLGIINSMRGFRCSTCGMKRGTKSARDAELFAQPTDLMVSHEQHPDTPEINR